MNANEIAFGIEFETTLPNSDTTPIGPYHGGYQVPWLPAGWRAERDSSIHPTTPDRKGCEFVSPKLRGPEGLKQIEDAIDAINAHDARVNPALVEKIINHIFLEGQLDECELTLKDISEIKKRFIYNLTGIMHKRIDYPGFDFGNGNSDIEPAKIEKPKFA